ncbi:hypothetical protein [Paracoccus chinensis]|uniref:Uncharacterized protein n=1 Tax=Paracoccus chinensis TaxID=525640 RepID=A0A1G9HA86_9RHOB|nr:hypothetical protein [Paracoccus chinensis]SDL09373.1 hypothetical protein SAMN04487971_10676 [Paracoccus chinensis]
MATRIYRETTSNDDAKAIAERIKRMEYELISIVTGNSTLEPNPLTARASATLAKMQRQLRALRIDMEVERRFDTAPLAVPRFGATERTGHLPSRVLPEAALYGSARPDASTFAINYKGLK